MRSVLLVPLAAAALAAAAPARACSVCAAGDPLVAAGDAAPTARELWTALEAEWLTASAAMDAPGMDGMIEEVDQGSLRVLAVYSPVARVNAVLTVPLVQKRVSATGAGMDHAEEVQTGLGDVELGARWFVLDRTSFAAMRHHSVALSAGTSFPTGNDDAEDASGQLLDQHSQLGTGGWGPYAGVMYRLEQSRWHAYASFTGRWRSENARAYRYGASLHWSVTAQRELGDSGRFVVGLGIDGREAAPDREDGADVAHTGGLVLAASPEVHVQLRGSWWLTARAQLPFATDLRGIQDVGPTFSAGVQVRAL